MIDRLSLTTFNQLDIDYLEHHGEITVDNYRKRIYKYSCRIGDLFITYFPHKFSERKNAQIPFARIDTNPKHYLSFDHFMMVLSQCFEGKEIRHEDLNVSRIDLAADMQMPIDILYAMMNVKHIKSNNFSIHKGTIYAGSNPKIRIYDKIKEIKARRRKGKAIAYYEEELIELKLPFTRFELSLGSPKITLKALSEKYADRASYFDRLEFFNVKHHENNGVMQFQYKKVNRKFRKEMEEFRNIELVETIKQKYIEGARKWFTFEEPF